MRNWGGGVTTQIVAGTKPVGENPNCVRLSPQLRKAAGPLSASNRSVAYNDVKMLKLDIKINYLERVKNIKILIHYNNLKIVAVCLAITLNSCEQNDGSVMVNGVKWATCNVDAPGTFAASPEDAGMFYQWNRKTAWNATDSTVIDWDATNPEGDVWEKNNDPCPAGWRLSTREEIHKLLEPAKVSDEWTTVKGINGRKFTDRETGKSIFMPATGIRGHTIGVLLDTGTNGFYWSSAPGSNTEEAYYLNFNSGYAHQYGHDRRYGSAVRCVADK